MANQDVTMQEILDYLGILIDQTDSVGNWATGNTSTVMAYTLINQGIQQVARILTDINEDFFLDKFEVHTVAGQREYTMPSTLRNPKMVFIDYNGGETNQVKALRIDPKKLTYPSTLDTDFDSQNPRYYLRGFRTIGIIPTPTVTTTGTTTKPLKVWGLRLPEKIVSATSTIEIPRETIELVALYAANVIKQGAYEGKISQLALELKDFMQPRGEQDGAIVKADGIWDDSFNSFEDHSYTTA